MNESLARETEALRQSWMRHDDAMLQDYLVSSVEDPRMNVQSLLTRHFLIQALRGDELDPLLYQELRFAVVMNWMWGLAEEGLVADDFAAIRHALGRGADNAEGIAIPAIIQQAFQAGAMAVGGVSLPAYLDVTLRCWAEDEAALSARRLPLDAFMDCLPTVWAGKLADKAEVLEVACGSANDYRFMAKCGLASALVYTGVDLCEKNIENARRLFPEVRFEVGNAFALAAADLSQDYCLAHDLFEHLSLEGIEQALAELCRVTRRGLCLGFFNMDECPDHIIRPVEAYHWNTLSVAQVRAFIEQRGGQVRVIHIGTFLRRLFGYDQTHNPNAYTLQVRFGA